MADRRIPTPIVTSPIDREIGRIVKAFTPSMEAPRLHYGVIVSASGGTATITVSGGTAQVQGVRYLADSTPSAGNVCVLLSQGGDMLIIGTLT
jgi:hypothetical protein